MNDRRRYYEAAVALVPLGSEARRVIDEMEAAGLSGVLRLEQVDPANGDSAQYRTMRLGTGAGSGGVGPLDRLMDEVDVVVMIAAALAEVEPALAIAVADAARTAGALVAGVVVERVSEQEVERVNEQEVEGGSEQQARDGGVRHGRAVLRANVDVVAGMRATGSARAFIDVIRGGRRMPSAAVARNS